MTVRNIVGQPYGMLVGYKYARDEQGRIIHKNGIPQATDELQNLGNGVYKYTGGWSNTLRFRDFSLSFLIVQGRRKPLLRHELLALQRGSAQGYVAWPYGRLTGRQCFIGAGVMIDDNGKILGENNVAVNAQDYHKGIVNNNIAEEFVYNASFIKLRELSLGYTFPQSVLNKMKVVKGLSVSLVGRNLWTILKHTDNIDPESAYNNTNGQGLELNGYPATRNVGFNVNVKF